MINKEKIMTSTVFFNNLTFNESVEEIKKLSKGGSFSYVVTPNVDHVQRLLGCESELLEVYRQASMSLCDSKILEKLLLLKGKRIKEVIPGSTLSHYVFDQVLTKEDRVLVVGVDERYIVDLKTRYPSLNILHVNPSMGFINKPNEVDELIQYICKVNPNYTFFCVGSPRQEILAGKIASKGLGSGVGMCVGASILFVVGAEKRAPYAFQVLHLEWAYRMFQDPGRLVSRYLKNFLALPSVIKSL